MRRLRDKISIVTGGAHGIGRAISELFAEGGAWVLVVDVDKEAAEFFCSDVSSREDTMRAVERVTGKFARVDILCNNAAYLCEWHDALNASEEERTRGIEVSLGGTDNFTRKVLPGIIRHVRDRLSLSPPKFKGRKK